MCVCVCVLIHFRDVVCILHIHVHVLGMKLIENSCSLFPADVFRFVSERLGRLGCECEYLCITEAV